MPCPQLSFTREVEIIASTLQPASTVHNFTFTLPAPSTPLASSPSTDLLRASVLTTNTDVTSYAYPYTDDPFARARPSSAYLGPSSSSFLSPNGHTPAGRGAARSKRSSSITLAHAATKSFTNFSFASLAP